LMPLGQEHAPALAEVGQQCRWPLTQRLIARRLAESIEEDAAPLEQLVVHVASSADPAAVRAVLIGVAEGLKGWRKAPMPKGWDRLAAIAAKHPDDEVAASLRELKIVFGDGRDLGDAVSHGAGANYAHLTDLASRRVSGQSRHPRHFPFGKKDVPLRAGLR
jgi:hypothetical protein